MANWNLAHQERWEHRKCLGPKSMERNSMSQSSRKTIFLLQWLDLSPLLARKISSSSWNSLNSSDKKEINFSKQSGKQINTNKKGKKRQARERETETERETEIENKKQNTLVKVKLKKKKKKTTYVMNEIRYHRHQDLHLHHLHRPHRHHHRHLVRQAMQ
jgi:hypothetical protein